MAFRFYFNNIIYLLVMTHSLLVCIFFARLHLVRVQCIYFLHESIAQQFSFSINYEYMYIVHCDWCSNKMLCNS